MKTISGVYKITNKTNGNFYIGSSIDIYKRFSDHRSALDNDNHTNKHLQRAWNKYGKDKFLFSILLVCDPQNTLVYEQRCIDNLNPQYNIAIYVDAPMKDRKHTKITRIRMSKAKKGKTPNHLVEYWTGKTLTEKHRNNISVAKTNPSKETRRKLSIAQSACIRKRRNKILKEHGYTQLELGF